MPKYSIRSSDLSAFTPTKNNTFVGFDEIFLDIISRLTEQCPALQILSIVGMAGIGKTTLARNVYDHSSVLCYFYIRVWVTISQEFRVREILLTAIFCANKGNPNENFAKFADEMSQVGLHELGLQLYRILSGRIFSIIMDDMWSIEACEKLKFFFPKGSDGSRIMITTRLSVMASYFGTCNIKIRISVTDFGRGQSTIASTLLGSTETPSS
ncbi:disease resistance protein RPP13-like [Primulina huaijiensis]|uniref:disease resistance protein RPP13-like n=1 Tax=Primulina huaijiensis TaxID=1492673 RepID=UPI003CC792CC